MGEKLVYIWFSAAVSVDRIGAIGAERAERRRHITPSCRRRPRPGGMRGPMTSLSHLAESLGVGVSPQGRVEARDSRRRRYVWSSAST